MVEGRVGEGDKILADVVDQRKIMKFLSTQSHVHV